MRDYAYTEYRAASLGDGTYELWTETNDDEDSGYPGVHANWRLQFNNLDQLKRHCGVSRQGIGHRVFVYLDGNEIKTKQDWPSQ